jgi:O-acetyl-ADP-ribose deacetylase (regulator of RNase III)
VKLITTSLLEVYDMKEVLLGGIRFVVMRGDITQVSADAIVVPANSLMLLGGGVAGAVKRKGGEEVEREARSRAPVRLGDAITTGPGRLLVKGIIHAPTMERPAGETSPEIVYLATRAAVREAERNGYRVVAFPGMGTGVGGIRPEVSARQMVRAILDTVKPGSPIETVYLVAYEEELERAFEAALETPPRNL